MGDGGGVVVQGCRPFFLFDSFVQASTCKETLRAFQELCTDLKLQPGDNPLFYKTLRSRLHYWRAKALWAKLDKRASQKEYQRGHACSNTTCLIIGAGPCGLRTAIELSFLGARVVLMEKRDTFSRNNVLHLWPFTIQDLRGLGAKKFYGKFCAGAIDHISIRQLQLILLKVALLLGVEVHVNVEFRSLKEPPENQENQSTGWSAEVYPPAHPVSELQFDVVVGADGRRNTLPGFRRKEFRGKLAIAITANFINRNTTAEAKVEEISGVAFIFNQRFFQELRSDTGIDLENIVYYKDDTHYFVMTAKKQSLLEKGVILHDYADTEVLLSRDNVDQNALLAYAREAADFSTNHQLPTLDFAMNHYGQPDVAMFDFTCMYATENAALVRQRRGHRLLVALVGDSLLEPFWPMGTGIARGFLAAMDTAWMVRSWGMRLDPLEVLAERESVYRLLPQTTPENVSKNYSQYSLDPSTRYPNLNTQVINASQVCQLIDTDEGPLLGVVMGPSPTSRLTHQDSTARSSKLLIWCQEQTQGYRCVCVTDLTTSWRSGLALCALLHRHRPDLIDFETLDESEAELNNQLALDIAELELGISPIMTGQEMSLLEENDSLCMVMYLSQLHDLLKDTAPPSETLSVNERTALMSSTKSPLSLLNKLGQSLSRKRNPKDKKEKAVDGMGKRRRTSQAGQSDDEEVSPDHNEDIQAVSPGSESITATVEGGNQSRVKSMASRLLAKFEENASRPSANTIRRQKKRTQQQEMMSFRYKEMIRVNTSRSEQTYIKMYTGGVSSLAEQIANQLQSQQQKPKPLLDKKELGSQRREFPVNIGGSDVCYFCSRRVYVMERLSAEGKFFHRSCFQCVHCSSTLHLSNYAYDELQGKFYCKQHYGYRLTGMAQRKRPAPITAPPHPAQAPLAPPPTPLSHSSSGSVEVVPPSDNISSSTPPDTLSGLAKRLCGTPERIALENYRSCLQEENSPLQEVPEETLAQHNLSLSLQEKGSEEQSSSSESELEEEGEEPLRRGVEPQARADGETELASGMEQRNKKEREKHEIEGEEQEEVSEEEEDGGESSDEGEYCPWETELHLGVWLKEEEASGIKESGKEHADELEVKLSDGETESSVPGPMEQLPSLTLNTLHSPTREPVHTHIATFNPPVTLEDLPTKRSGVIEEFWLKSAEIRKSLGQSVVLVTVTDQNTPSLSTGDTFYTSKHTTTDSNLPLHTPCKRDSINQTSGTPTLSAGTKASSMNELQSPNTRFQGGTSSCADTHPPEARIENVSGMKRSNELEGIVDHSSTVHRLSITLESQIAEQERDLTTNSSSNTMGTKRVSAPDLRFLPVPSSPLTARQELDLNRSDPTLNREILLSSHTVPLRTEVIQHDRLKSHLNRAQSLPPVEVEVLYAGDADKLHPCPAIPYHASDTEVPMSSLPKIKDRSALEGRRARSEVPLQMGGAEALQQRAEIKPLEEENLKKRTSLFSPRKNRKSANLSGETQQELGKHKSLWKSVFSGYKKEKKRKELERHSRTLPGTTSQESRKRMPGFHRTSDLSSMKDLSFSEETDLCCSVVLDRSPLRAQLSQEVSDLIRSDGQKERIEEVEGGVEEREESVYVPHALAFKRAYAIKKHSKKSQRPNKKAGTEDELDAKLTRRVQRAARRQAKQEELKRLHRAQIIQRQLEQVEMKQRQLEEKGIAVEKALRGEAVEPFLGSPRRRPISLCPCCSQEAKAKGTEHDHSVYVCTVFFLYVVHEPPLHQLRMGKKDDPSLMHQWFKLVQEKNALVRYESELMIFARELELEDRQSHLQQELRERMAVDDHLKNEEELAEERRILGEMLDVVEQRDALVALLEEQRLKEREEDSDLEAAMLSKGFSLHWA
ncbi:protein-methionine sulfoxide oxidase mical3b isoform X6 [Tachysurus fulvidraco]|uniref:protein-methionine sulfoxide oxidase mical3b isoform X6 n=1 Tax=Tachysurus fulvidraco TaxID=1234273 RepID=UPI001FED9B00|nr:protein-methionine sulfoxide oxidase mical3b isoform X6 [Tachysurus fulvidraco]